MTNIIVFSIYFFLIYIIAIIARRKIKSAKDFILAGRSLSPALTALGAGAADMSGWIMMALPGAIFLDGASKLWIPVGLVLGAFLNWQFLAGRLRVYTYLAEDSLTIPSFLENRFSNKKGYIRLITAFAIVFFFTFYIAAGFKACGMFMQSIFSISYVNGIIIGAVFILIYTLLGGFLAASWIDFFQGTLMLLSLLAVPATLIYSHNNLLMDGFTNMPLNRLDIYHSVTWIEVISFMGWGLGYFGQPHIISRFMAIKNVKHIATARLIGMAWMSLSLYGAILTGFLGWIYFSGHLPHPDLVFLKVAKNLFSPILYSITMAAVFSAIISTAASQLISSSSSISEDFYFIKFKKIWITKISISTITIISSLIAILTEWSLLEAVSYSWSGLGATFGPVILVSLYWKNMSYRGCLLGMISGALTVIIWSLLNMLNINVIFSLTPIVPGFFVNILFIFLFSDTNQDNLTFQKFEKALLESDAKYSFLK